MVVPGAVGLGVLVPRRRGRLGLVAVDHGVDGADLLADVEAALGRSVDGSDARSPPAPRPSTARPAADRPDRPDRRIRHDAHDQPDGAGDRPDRAGAPDDTDSPADHPTNDPCPPEEILLGVGDILDGLLDPVDDLIGGLL